MPYRGWAKLTVNSNDDHSQVVIVSFASGWHIDQWFSPAGFQPLVALREEGIDMHMIDDEVMTR